MTKQGNREKVVKGLECCLGKGQKRGMCEDCPYNTGRMQCNLGDMHVDALDLLKEQEPVKPETMRLIDLDQIVVFTITDETQGGMQYEMQMTVAEVFDKFFNGFQPEVVDAIPVEWLKTQIAPYRGDVSDISKGAHNATIKNLIRKWQNEQGGEQ